MNLLNMLKVRKEFSNRNSLQVDQYEIPPLYGFFHNIFDLNNLQYLAVNFMYNNSSLDGLELFFLKLDNIKLQIISIFSIDELLNDFNAYLKDEELYLNNRLVRIGLHEFGGGIYLGCDPMKNFDQVFIYFWDDQKLIKCANNIFEFIAMINSEIDQYQIDKIIGNPSNLYKNWNEDFWRIKPPEFRDARPYELLDKDSLDKRYSELKKSKVDLLDIENEYKIRGLDLPKKFLFW
jgi:hypothetical protein